ncbi:MAG: MFS transporter [SAR202 cluster bacterium]|nr:MFS transporter [SAR202 cluster bacterium]|tara:strand:+ start:10068 stop:11270 length:1203 start_codon:yes stop_codon:yes gene_type:complete
MLSLFKNQTFRRFFYGLLFDDAAMMVSPMLQGWIVLMETNSAFWVGVTAGASGVGLTLFSPVAGVLIDRYNRKLLLVITQFGQILLTGFLGIVAFYEAIEVWHVLGFGFCSGAFHALRYPCKMAMTLDLVGPQNLLRGTAANFFSMTVMGVIAPIAGGWLIAREIYFGFAFIFLALLVSSIVFLNLKGIKTPQISSSSHFEDLVYGAKYVAKNTMVRSLILAILVTEIFGWAVEAMLPVIARDELGLDAQGLGFLMSVGALGAAISTVCITAMPDVDNKGKLIVYGLFGFGFGLIAFAFSDVLMLSMILLAFAYGSGVIYESGLSTLLQTSVPDGMRGRVLSFQSLCWGFSGSAGFHAGAIAAILGAPIAVAAGGAVVIINATRIARNMISIGAKMASGK